MSSSEKRRRRASAPLVFHREPRGAALGKVTPETANGLFALKRQGALALHAALGLMPVLQSKNAWQLPAKTIMCCMATRGRELRAQRRCMAAWGRELRAQRRALSRRRSSCCWAGAYRVFSEHCCELTC